MDLERHEDRWPGLGETEKGGDGHDHVREQEEAAASLELGYIIFVYVGHARSSM